MIKLFYPVKNPINPTNLFGANPQQYAPQKGHPGNDFECPIGTPIFSPCDGDAFYATDQKGGDGIWIRYPNNAEPTDNIILWHMPTPGTPTEKQYPFQIPTDRSVVRIKAGQLLGYSGNSGFPLESTGPHCHAGWMPCDATGGALNVNNGYLGCEDIGTLWNGLYAENILHPEPVPEPPLPAPLPPNPTPIQEITWLASVKVWLGLLLKWLQK